MKTSARHTERILLTGQFTLLYRQARARAQWTSESQNDYKALFVLGGKFDCSIENENYELNDRSALLLAPHEAATAAGKDVEYLVLALAPSFVLDTSIEVRLIRSEALIFFHTKRIERDEKLARLASDLKAELIEAEAGQEVVTKALVAQTLVHILRRYANFRRSDELELSRVGLVDRRIRRAVELMHTHLDCELPLEEIAAAAYLSPFHFARLFKKLTGASPHAYLAHLRQTRAQTLLAETDLSVTDISQRVGYGSSSHFTKAFRQATGFTPRGFRQALVGRGNARS
jgi:AraC family transcriptional regulator